MQGVVVWRDMANFGEKIKQLRERKYLSRGALADKAGVTEKAIWKWENSPTPKMRGESYRNLAEALGMTTDQLDREWRPQGINQTIGDPVRRGIPLINKAPAGNIVNYDECGIDSGQGRWYVEREGITDPNAFAVSIIGDSMPTLTPGHVAIFSPLDTDGYTHHKRLKIEDGHICFVRFGSDAPCEGCTVARVFRQADGKVKLVKDNKKYKAIVCRPDEIVQMSALIRIEVLPGMMEQFFASEQLMQEGAREGQVFPNYDQGDQPPAAD